MTDTQPPGRTEDTSQLPGESDAAYAAFLIYRDCPRPRTVTDAYNAFLAQKALGQPKPAWKSPSGAWKQWAKAFRWIERARAYDARHDAHVEKAREKAIVMAEEEKARLRANLPTQEVHFADTIITLAASAVEKVKELLSEETQDGRGTWNGKTVVKSGSRLRDAVSMLERLQATFSEAFDRKRMALEMPVKVQEAPPDNLRDVMFESVGQVAAAAPPGTIPEMPADVFQKPAISTGKPTAGVDGAPRKPAKVRPA